MIRTIIAVLLLVGLLGNLDHTLPEILLGYAIVAGAILWLTWPVLSALGRGLRRLRRRRRPAAKAPATTSAAPHLTQINHHYYFGHTQAPPAPQVPPRIDRTVPELAQQTEQQRHSTSIYDILDLDDGPDR